MTIGIGGAGSKVATRLAPNATIVNVSETELNKVDAGRRLLAVVHAPHGQFRGSRKNPLIGRDAYLSVKRELLDLARGTMVVSSTGGGTGNGITSGLLTDLSVLDDVIPHDKTVFVLILPCPQLEPAEYTKNTIAFIQGPLSDAIDSGNSGNIILFSNQLKFESRLSEDRYNQMLVDSLSTFLAIPKKNEALSLLDGHIDYEDFTLYTSRPYFNHFTYFDYDPEVAFEEQLTANANPLLLPPEAPIEAMFLLEVPTDADPTIFYDILQFFADNSTPPVYSVVENPARKVPFVTTSLLYSRKPAELLADFNKVSERHAHAKMTKSLEQYVVLPELKVSLEKEAQRAAKQRGTEEDVLAILKRLGKL